jgi:hypothetical protein
VEEQEAHSLISLGQSLVLSYRIALEMGGCHRDRPSLVIDLLGQGLTQNEIQQYWTPPDDPQYPMLIAFGGHFFETPPFFFWLFFVCLLYCFIIDETSRR